MYAIQLVEPSLNAFRRTSLPDPEPGPGDVLIRLRAAALNYIDVAVATGRFPGAALPIAATTAWNAVRSAQVRPGSTVVILGTGGVSLFALQFARASGATVILASSSDEKLERGRALGATHLINYRAAPDWDARVLELTGGRGAELVVETVGDATFSRSLNAAALGGTVFTVGFLSGAATSIDLFAIIGKSLRVVGNSTGSVADLAEAVRAIEANRIVPVVDRVFGFDEAAGAYEQVAGGRHVGKVGIVIA
jgi:NADPH:quinone reductase-like Zn-dependent oxidoreductase